MERGLICNAVSRQTLTVEEAGRALGISRGSAYLAAKSGQLPTIRVGGRLLVPLFQLGPAAFEGASKP